MSWFSDVVKTVGQVGGDVLKNPVTYLGGPVLGAATSIARVNKRARDASEAANSGGMVSSLPFQGVNYDENGRPILEDFKSNLGPDGQLKEAYQLKNNLNTQGLEAMRGEALRDPGTMSRWGQMALTNAQNENAAQNAGSYSQATNRLAMQGGLRTGARERLASQGAQSQLLGNQNALNNVQNQDEMSRQKWLGMLPGQELAAAQYGSNIQDTNIKRSLGEVGAGRDYDMFRYGKAMEAYGADRTSDAMARSAKDAKATSGLFGGGGFLGLGF